MSRYMYDATHDGLASIPSDAEMVAGYDTGSSGIKWTSADWAKFPKAVHVHIDQANGGPVYSANVMDVEAGAYAVSDIANWTAHCTAPRPTAYVNGSEETVALADFKGDIWLASPGISDAQALSIMAADNRIVAVQNLWATNYDRSIVSDNYWPMLPPTSPTPTAKEYELQVEGWQPGFGWVLDDTFKTPVRTKYRVRVSDGAWSDWQEFSM